MLRFERSLVRKLRSGEVKSPHAQKWGSYVSTFLAMGKSDFHVKSCVNLDRSGKVTFILGHKYILREVKVPLVKSGETHVNELMSRRSQVPKCS
jgi:hypothetical protein